MIAWQRLDPHRPAQPLEIGEIISGPLDRLPRAQLAHVLCKQRRIHRVRMVEIDFDPFFVAKARVVAVIIILLQHHHARFRKRFDNPARDRRFARAGASANSDDQRSPIQVSRHVFPFTLKWFQPLRRTLPFRLRRIFPAFDARSSSITACAAANRATATRNGDALT